jgi:4-hydroxybenzoate polyprenyltransferase
VEIKTDASIFIRIADHFFVLRPMLHLPVWTILLLGYSANLIPIHYSTTLLLVLVSGTGLFGAVFLINQIYDIESDRINDKIHFLPKGIISIKTAWVMTIALNLVSLAIAFTLSMVTGFVALLIVMLGIAYSVPPIVLKNRSWLAILANALGHGTLVYLLGYVVAGGDLSLGALRSLPYFFAVGAVYIGTTLPDIDGDKSTGKITLGVKLGLKKAILLLFALYLAALVVSLFVGDIIFWIAAGIVAPFYFWALTNRTTRTSLMAIKASILSLSLAAAYLFPLYLIFLILLIIATRYYYKYRFQLDYPSLF